jgi:hypothetical protein
MANVELYFDGLLALKKGEIVRVWSGMEEGPLIRVGRVENVSAGSHQTSRIVGATMTKSPVELNPPITGVVVGSEIRNKSTYFTLATGVYLDPERFFRDGSHQEGQDVLKTILGGEIGGYVKVLDPYTTPETLDLLAVVRAGTKIQVLCGQRTATGGLRTKADSLRRGGLDIEVRVDPKGMFHDRFIVTGRGAWSVGQSLSDFGKKASYLSRIDEPRSLEQFFSDCWDSASKL